MPDDAIAALLPLLIGGTGGGGGSMSPDAMGALQAMQTPFAQGETSHAGPVGQITQALMPLVAGPAYAQQARQQQAEQQRNMLIKVLTLTKELKGIDLQDKKLQAEAEALGVNKDFMKRYLELHGAVHGGATDEMVKNAKMTVGPHGASFTMGGADPKTNELDLVKQVAGPGAAPQAVLDALAAQKQKELAGNAMAKIPAEVEAARQKAALKKPLKPEELAQYSGAVSSLGQLDKTIASFKNNEVTRGDVAKATLTHGLLSHPTLRQYAGFYNDVAQGRYKSRLTAAEIERLSQELPPPTAYALDPSKFVDSLNVARRHLADSTAKRMLYQSKNYDIPPEIVADVARLTTPAMPTHQIPANIDIEVPPKYSAQAKQIFNDNIGAGQDATTAARAVQSWLMSQPQEP